MNMSSRQHASKIFEKSSLSCTKRKGAAFFFSLKVSVFLLNYTSSIKGFLLHEKSGFMFNKRSKFSRNFFNLRSWHSVLPITRESEKHLSAVLLALPGYKPLGSWPVFRSAVPFFKLKLSGNAFYLRATTRRQDPAHQYSCGKQLGVCVYVRVCVSLLDTNNYLIKGI